MTQLNKQIVCEGNVMHQVIAYEAGPVGFVECMAATEPSVPAPREFATPHPNQNVPRSDLLGIKVVRYYGNVTEEVL